LSSCSILYKTCDPYMNEVPLLRDSSQSLQINLYSSQGICWQSPAGCLRKRIALAY
jgi:hypothetical protein